MMKKPQNKQQYYCRDCQHSYGWYEKNYKGEPFMCKCKFSDFSKLLSEKQCGKFKLRNGEKE